MVENHPDTREAGIPRNCLPGAVCVLFCADEYVCTFGGRSAVDAEEFFSQSCGGAGSGCFAFAGGRAVSYPQGKSAVFSERSIFGTMGVLCNFYAVDHLVLADASILNKMSPFFTVLFSWLILKEKVMPIQLSLIFGAFLGSIFVVKPTFSNLALVPSLLGFFGGICAGAAYTMVRKLGEAGEKGPVIVLFFSVFSCVVVLPWLIFDYHPMTWQQMGILLLAGCAAAGGQFAITAAYRYAPASRISIYDYSQLIFSTMLGFFIFGQVPDGWSFLGYGIICLMAIFMFVYNNRKRKNTQKQALLESKEPSDVIKM